MEVIREAVVEDIPAILKVAEEFSNEAPVYYKWDKEKTAEVIEGLIEDNNSCVLVLDDNGIKGGLIFTVTQMIFSNKSIATELAWFVTKEYRGSRSSLKLVKQYEKMCFDAGVDFVAMADIKGVTDLEKVYTKLGFNKTETSYIKAK